MPIPKLNGKGVLPPINGEPFSTTSLELCQRYGTTPERRAVLRGLLDLRATMRELQFDGGWQWVAGEFLEDDRLHPEPPRLIKVVSFCTTPDCFKDHEYADLAATIRKREKTLKKFHVDHTPVLLSWPPDLLIKYTTLWQGQMSRQASSGLAVGYQLTPDGEKKLTAAGIAPGQKFQRALLLDLYRTGDAFTHGTGVDDPAATSQLEMDFANDPDPETAFPACDVCRSVNDLHLTLTGTPGELVAQLQCAACRAIPAARPDTSIPGPLALPTHPIPALPVKVSDRERHQCKAIRGAPPRRVRVQMGSPPQKPGPIPRIPL